MNKTVDMTKGSYWKLIITFAIPIFISNLFQQLYNSVDSLIVGNFLGKEALAAVSSSGNLIFLFVSFFNGMSMGSGVLISKFFGQKDYDSMRKAIHTAICFGLFASVTLTILGVSLSPVILKLMGTAEDVLPKSIEYFRYYFLGITGVVMYNIFAGTLQALGNSRRPLMYLIISSCTNVILDLLFIGVFKMGVGSAALATSISQMLSALMCFLFLIKEGTIYQVKLESIRFHKGMLSQIMRYGVPSGIQNSVISIANVFVQSNINSFGSDAMAACGSFSKLEGFAFLPVTCFTMAISTFTSQNLGAREHERAKKGATFGIICSITMAEVIGLIMFILAPQLISLFNSDPNVVSIGVRQIRTESLFFCLLAFSHCIAAVCRGSGRPVVPMMIMLIIWCGIRVLYLSIAMKISHEIGLIFWAYPITWGLSAIVYLFYFLFSDWQHGFDKVKNG